MLHQFIPPPESLQGYVRYFWTVDFNDVTSSSTYLQIFACRFPRLVFQHYNGNSALKIDDLKLPTAFLSGINVTPYTSTMDNRFTITGVSFYPQAIKLIFGIDAHEIVNGFPELQNFAPRYLIDRLQDANGHSEIIAILQKFLLERICKNNITDLHINHSVVSISRNIQDITLTRLTNELHISERQLERKFKSYLGLSPKQFMRVTRFEKTIELMQQNNKLKLSNLAYDFNYTDSSHFTKEFKEFSGFTPKVFINQTKLLEESSSMVLQDIDEFKDISFIKHTLIK